MQTVSANTVLQPADFIAAVCITAGCRQSIHPGGWFPVPEVGGLRPVVAAMAEIGKGNRLLPFAVRSDCAGLRLAVQQPPDEILENILFCQFRAAQPGQIAQQNAQIQLICTAVSVEIDAVDVFREQLL